VKAFEIRANPRFVNALGIRRTPRLVKSSEDPRGSASRRVPIRANRRLVKAFKDPRRSASREVVRRSAQIRVLVNTKKPARIRVPAGRHARPGSASSRYNLGIHLRIPASSKGLLLA
jgi:hypothetical protein